MGAYPCFRLLPLLLGSLCLQPVGAAADISWIQLCGPDGPLHSSGLDRREYLTIDGDRRWLELSASPSPGCKHLALPVASDEIRWFSLIPESTAQRLPRGVILQGVEEGKQVRISEVVVAESAQTHRTPLPLATNLFSRLNPRVFGVEERAGVAVTGESLRLSCAPGERPAGVVLRNDGARLPAAIESQLLLSHRADSPFRVGYADGGRHSIDDPRPIGVVPMSPAGESQPQALRIPLPGNGRPPVSAPAQTSVAFTFLCPPEGGRLLLSKLQLEPAQAGVVPNRSIWIWRPVEWLERPERLLAELRTLSTPVVYITIPMEDGRVAQPEQLARFIDDAGAQSIQVWAVEGDPHAVLPAGRIAFARRARALAAFNSDQPPGRRLSGVQYDIEPYLLPDFALHTSDWLAAYVLTIAALDAALDMPVEIAVPFWWSSLTLGDQPLLESLAPHVQSVNVMNYRTDPVQLQQFAEPFLSWGARQGIPVRIALEAGPIGDEARWHFRAVDHVNDKSTLWHLPLAGEQLLVLLEAPAAPATGIGYQFVRQSRFEGSRLTFRGDRARMDRVMGELESVWRAWPSFAGLALHEYRLQGE